jgi:hypothetical protein
MLKDTSILLYVKVYLTSKYLGRKPHMAGRKPDFFCRDEIAVDIVPITAKFI